MERVDVSMYWHERCHHSRAQQWLRQRVRAVLVAQAPGAVAASAGARAPS
jgi:hypothetical protein